jgi:YVTN family beta-propeller protein
VIDTATNTVVSTVGGMSHPRGVAVTPDGKRAYVTNAASNTVSVIDTASNTVVGTPILVGDNPFVVTVAPDGKHAYVTNLTSNTVSVIDTASDTVAATVPVGSNPVGVGIVPPQPGVPYGGGHGPGGE